MPSANEASSRWWRNPFLTVPLAGGILAAVIGGVTTAVLQSGGSSPAATRGIQTSVPTPSNSVSATPIQSADTGPPTPTLGAVGALRWRARISLQTQQWIKIDADAPTAGDISNGTVGNGAVSPGNPEDITLTGIGDVNGNVRGGIAPGLATYNDCSTALNTNATQQYVNNLEPGETLCVLSSGAVQHLAALRMVRFDSSSCVLVFEVTVWTYSTS